MPQAIIEINGTALSDTDVPIATLLQLSNDDVGDESTYLWEVLFQPAGAVDALSSTVIENPTITPNKEGTYLFQLTVDQGLPTEVVDKKVARVRHLKTFAELQGSQETIEVDAANGWGPSEIATLTQLLDRVYDGGIVAAVAGGVLAAGSVVLFDGFTTIKSGLPGAEDLPDANQALATSADVLDNSLGIVISKPDGGTGIVASDVILVRMLGYMRSQTFTGVPAAVGDPVFVDDAGAVALAAGSNSRKIGNVVQFGGGVYRIFVNGVGFPA